MQDTNKMQDTSKTPDTGKAPDTGKTPDTKMISFPHGDVELLPGQLSKKPESNRRYLLSLDTENLLRNHYIEAGLWQSSQLLQNIHGGWESPTCQLRVISSTLAFSCGKGICCDRRRRNKG